MRKPVPYLLFPNLFTKTVSERILEEIISLEDIFEPSKTGEGSVIENPYIRTNIVLFMDKAYPKEKRFKSFFITVITKLFKKDTSFRDSLASSAYPINEFLNTNTHDIQVSRYGDDGQKFDWHLDRINKRNRILTLVYYFFKEPKEWTGGQIQFTDSPIVEGKAVEPLIEGENLVTIQPTNNLGIVFGATTAHRVLPTQSPKEFNKGRFSASVWVGIK